MKKIKIAQIGTSRNSHGTAIWNSLKKQPELFEIAGFVMPEQEKEKFPEQVRDFEGYKELRLEEILENPEIEAVTVETEEIYLTKYAALAAKHGKHMHMEKPGGTDLGEFEKLISTVKSNQTVFHTGYMYRYNPIVMELMEKIRAGELGEIINVEAQMNCYHTQTTRQWLSCFPGGMMFFLGCHLVDLILQIQGVPEEIIPMSCSTGLDGIRAADFGMALFRYKNGISFAKTSAVETGGSARRYLMVSGTKGTVELKPMEVLTEGGQYTDVTEYRKPETWRDPGEQRRSIVYDRYDDMVRSFGAMVLGEKKNPWNYDYELLLYKTVLQACGVGC